jgi:uncharacterized protein with gpF-like domain
MRRAATLKRGRVLRPIHSNAGIAAAYRRRLCSVIAEMARSYEHWIAAQYRAEPPRMAQDATPAAALERELKKLGRRWEKRFEELAPRLAEWFTKSARTRSDAALSKMLRDAGMSVKFTMTPTMRDVLGATVAEQISLIKSIGTQYHSEVDGMVMRSVTTGRDLAQLSKDLQKRYGITQRRAAFIALDQNNKSTAALRRVRELDLGLEKEDEENGIWLHSGGGKEPRETHKANHGKRFSIRSGWFDNDPKVRERILPGQLPRCRCTWRVAIKGFS